jgi:glutamate-1-semialdehyde aminotransferase
VNLTERGKGVPVNTNSIKFDHGDLAELIRLFDASPKQIAAVVVEPEYEIDYLDEVRKLCTQRGALLVFDEVITGFRYRMGGSNTTQPDISTFGKSIANGMPISAIAGRREIMKLMEPPNNIFYSGTFFGETLSIAAAIATIKKLDRVEAHKHIWAMGRKIYAAVTPLIHKHGLDKVISLAGFSPRLVAKFRDTSTASPQQIQTLFMEEMAKAGVLVSASHNISYAIKEPEVKRIIRAYDHTLGVIADALKSETFGMTAEGLYAAVR